MRFFNEFAALLPLLGSVAGTQLRHHSEGTPSLFSEYIVEYERTILASRQAGVLNDPGIEVIQTFNSPLFQGASVKSTAHSQDSLAAIPGVARVWHNHQISLDPERPGQSFSDDAASANYSTHISTGVAPLHAAGLLGKGVKIGVVDTGIDYNHPALGAGFGDGFKVAGGYDFVGDGAWPDYGEKEPDEDPMDFRSHGTHVAGIIAGQADFFRGVAPESTLYAYKVFTQVGSTDEATLIEAFLRAVDDGMDIITASIGGASGWADNAWASVASRIAEQGIVVTVSAGNDGDSGPFFGSSGSSGKHVIAVASVEGEMAATPSFRANFRKNNKTNSSLIGYIPSVNSFDPEVHDWPIIPISNDTHEVETACQPFPEGAHNLTEKIPLVRRGGCPMQTKQENLNALGARYILLYNDETPLTQLYTDNDDSAVALIEDYSGEAIVEAVNAGVAVTADFNWYWLDVVGLPRDFANTPSTFTSWGGLNDLQLKPDIAAPGGEIFSTLPRGMYGSQSGTSMACPYVAGVVALYIQAQGGRSVHGKDFAKQVMQRVISSGTTLQWWDNASWVAPPMQVGTGLINATKMINYTTTLGFNKMELNDTANFNAVHAVTVENLGKEMVEYTLGVEDASGFEIYYDYDGGQYSPRIKAFEELVPKKMPVDVVLPKAFKLAPGEAKTVEVTFSKPPSEWNSTNLPLYSGKIFVNGTNNESLSIPYFGLGANLHKEMDSFFMYGSPTLTTTIDSIDIHQKPNWTNNVWDAKMDWPYLTLQMKWATAELRWDIYEPGFDESTWEYPPVVGQNGYLGSATNYAESSSESFDWLSGNPELTVDFPISNLNRNGIKGAYRHTLFWFGKLANGTQIEPGQYDMRIAALKPFGDRAKSADWAIFDTPTVSILGKYGKNPRKGSSTQ